jgi:hypothetical protein
MLTSVVRIRGRKPDARLSDHRVSGFGADARTLQRMQTRFHRAWAIAVVVVVGLLTLAPGAFAGSAVDQYTEGIPTAGGQEPSRDAVGNPSSGNSAPISSQTRNQLGKSKEGSAAEKAADLTAPARHGNGLSGPSDAGGGLGFLLPLILVAALAAAVAIFIARRRADAAPG